MNIIINGPGRSGTTLLSKLLSHQKDLAWISGWVNRYPNIPQLSFLNFLYRKKIFGYEFSEVSKFPKPAEAYNFWKFYIKNFQSGYKPSEEELFQLKKAIEIIISWQNKKHFVTKVTGDLRENVFDKIFSSYRLVWIERDPRVVVSSYLKQKWFYKNKLEDFNKMSHTDKIKFYSNYYMKIYNQSKPVDCEIVFYEDLCDNPLKFFDDLLFKLDLEFTDALKDRILKKEINKVDWSNYEKKYTEKEVKLLNELLKEPLNQYGYI